MPCEGRRGEGVFAVVCSRGRNRQLAPPCDEPGCDIWERRPSVRTSAVKRRCPRCARLEAENTLLRSALRGVANLAESAVVNVVRVSPVSRP